MLLSLSLPVIAIRCALFCISSYGGRPNSNLWTNFHHLGIQGNLQRRNSSNIFVSNRVHLLHILNFVSHKQNPRLFEMALRLTGHRFVARKAGPWIREMFALC